MSWSRGSTARRSRARSSPPGSGGSYRRCAGRRSDGSSSARSALGAAYARSDWLANSNALVSMTREWAAPLPLPRFAMIPNRGGAGRSDTARRRGSAAHRDLGRAHAFKGVDVLLEVFASLEDGAASMRMVGAGVPAAVAERPDLAERVEVSDRVPDPWDVLGPVDVLVVPSRRYSEGLAERRAGGFRARRPRHRYD